MKKENSTVLIIGVVVLALLVLGLGGFIVYDKMINKTDNNDIIEDNNKDTDKTEDTEKNEVIYTYTVEGGETSLLTLDTKNMTYKLGLNVCRGIFTIDGTYTKDDKNIILNVTKKDEEFVLPDTITLEIKFDDEHALELKDENIGCLFKGQIFSKVLH